MTDGRKRTDDNLRGVFGGDEPEPAGTTTYRSIVHDQGGGGSWCDNCGRALEESPRTPACLGCGLRFVAGGRIET